MNADMRTIRVEQSGEEVFSGTVSETGLADYATSVAEELRGGEVLALIGDLGAGKTTFTKALAKALGIKEHVTSPTFVLMKLYSIEHPTIHTLCHVDAYRLSSADELEAIGISDYLGQPGVVTVIEWADRVEKVLPEETLQIQLAP